MRRTIEFPGLTDPARVGDAHAACRSSWCFSQRVEIEESLLSFAASPDAREPTARRSRRTRRSLSAPRRDATVLDTSREITRHTGVCPVVREPTSQRVNPEMAKIPSL